MRKNIAVDLKMARSGTVFLSLFVLMIFLLELFVFTWSRVECVRTGRLIAKESQEYSRHLELKRKLELERAHLKSSERLATKAKKEFGLVVPGPGQVISVK